jgi:hypothetical protein
MAAAASSVAPAEGAAQLAQIERPEELGEQNESEAAGCDEQRERERGGEPGEPRYGEPQPERHGQARAQDARQSAA